MDDFDDQIKQTTKNPWYAVRTFNCQELKISDFLKERKKVHFVPMTYVEKEKEGKNKENACPGSPQSGLFTEKREPQGNACDA